MKKKKSMRLVEFGLSVKNILLVVEVPRGEA